MTVGEYNHMCGGAVATFVRGSDMARDLCHSCCKTSGGIEAHCDGPSSSPSVVTSGHKR